jgi:hypothetical protein
MQAGMLDLMRRSFLRLTTEGGGSAAAVAA